MVRGRLLLPRMLESSSNDQGDVVQAGEVIENLNSHLEHQGSKDVPLF